MTFGRDAMRGPAGEATPGTGGRPLSEINVTPLVDVMLVLLVIFIITAPLMTSSIKLDLPKSTAGQPNDTPKFVSLVVDAAGQLFVDDRPIGMEALPERLARAAAQGADTELQLRADRQVPYGRIVELMGIANRAGLARIGFVTEAEADPAR